MKRNGRKAVNFAPGNAQHIGARRQQEDAFGFSDPGNPKFVAHGGLLGVLADGMGGLERGGQASRTAVRAFLHAYEAKTPEESVPAALQRALRAANQSVVDLARDAGLEHQVGTTLVAAAATGKALYWVSAGDSRLYLWRGGRLTQLTHDHIYAGELDAEVAAGLLSRDEAQNHPERDSVTSFLGAGEVSLVDRNVRPFPLRPGDQVLMCSDGLYRALDEQEIAATMNGNAEAACERLIERALAQRLSNQDNITVMAWECAPRAGTTGGRKSTPWMKAMAAVLLTMLIGFGGGVWWWAKTDPEPPSPPQIVVPPSPNPGASGEVKRNRKKEKKKSGNAAAEEKTRKTRNRAEKTE